MKVAGILTSAGVLTVACSVMVAGALSASADPSPSPTPDPSPSPTVDETIYVDVAALLPDQWDCTNPDTGVGGEWGAAFIAGIDDTGDTPISIVGVEMNEGYQALTTEGLTVACIVVKETAPPKTDTVAPVNG